MPDTSIRLPAQGTGDRALRGRDRGGTDPKLVDQYVALAAAETWDVLADAVALAANKHHITIFNPSSSGKVVRIRKLFAVNLQTAAVTGAAVRFDWKKATASSAGTQLTPVAHDSANASLGTVHVRTGGTVTEGALHFPWMTTAEEEPATQPLTKSMFQQSVNLLPEGPEVQEYVAREGEGYTLKQISAVTVGSYAWLMVFTID